MASESTGAHGAEASSSFPPFQQVDTFGSQVFWLVITFAVLYFVLSRVILPRIGGTLERRKNAIASDLDAADDLNTKAVEAKRELEKKLADARAQARATADKARADMDAEISAETKKVEAELDAKLEAAESRLRELQVEAMSNVKSVATEAAEAVVVQLGGSASRTDIDQAVSSVLKG